MPQLSPPRPPEASVTTRTGQARHGLLAAAIIVAGVGGGLLAWHPWDKGPAPEPPKDPHHITIQRVGEQRDPTGDSEGDRPVYCMTNETGSLYCMVMPGRYAGIQEEQR
ncbi:hypothetical protein [Nocardia brevicatena]|uniref:hypothetical protein n=1 Tax=Nocardia brevicatena TaxID=37327 RepID=UPI000300340A|nr:hypothetical protein [Nocardia brevicatena]